MSNVQEIEIRHAGDEELTCKIYRSGGSILCIWQKTYEYTAYICSNQTDKLLFNAF